MAESSSSREALSQSSAGAAPVNSSRRRAWAVLLILDTILVIVFGGALAGMLVLDGEVPSLLRSWLEPAPPVHAVPNRRQAPAKPAPAAAPAVSTSTTVALPAPPPAAPPPAAVDTKPLKAKPVEFVCSMPGSGKVYLKGAFLRTGRKRMKKGADGKWHLKIYLTPQPYKYYCSAGGKDSEPLTMEVAP